MVNTLVLKYVCGLGVPQKYITTKFYIRYVTYVKMEDYIMDLCIRVFHVYGDIWEATEGEVAKL